MGPGHPVLRWLSDVKERSRSAKYSVLWPSYGSSTYEFRVTEREIRIGHVGRYLSKERQEIWRDKFSSLEILVNRIILCKQHSGSREMPADPATAKARMWTPDNAKSRFLISSSMEASRLESLLVYKTAKRMWDRLCLSREQKFKENKMDPPSKVPQI